MLLFVFFVCVIDDAKKKCKCVQQKSIGNEEDVLLSLVCGVQLLPLVAMTKKLSM